MYGDFHQITYSNKNVNDLILQQHDLSLIMIHTND